MPQQSGRPRPERRTVVAIGGGLVVVAAAGLALVYFVLFPTSSPKRFALATSSTASEPNGSGKSLAGTWSVTSGSQAGYRVREKLAFLPAQSDAVGRTSAITGAATLAGSVSGASVTAASFDADVSKLTSDKTMRDQRIRTIGLQSDQYPTVTFKLSEPIALPASAVSGKAASLSAVGVFNIHGTSRTETVPMQLRISRAGIEVVGSISFPWSEFSMTAPSVGGFVNVTNTATVEFDLHLRRA